MIKLTLPGKIPSKKNSRSVFNGFLVTNKRYKDWHKWASNEIIIARIKRERVKVSVLNISFYLPDNRGRDLTNMAESIMDLLVDREVIDDDKWQSVPHLVLKSLGIDRVNPRAEIEIYEFPLDNK